MTSFLIGKGDWPVFEHDPDIDSVEWRLRHNPDSVTREDMHYAASVMAAYRYLMYIATTRPMRYLRWTTSEMEKKGEQ